MRSCGCGVLIRGLQNLGAPCKGVRVVTFCIVQKVTKKHARTCKKLPVASFCASETAETGRIANGREQGDHVSRRRESYKVFCPTFCALQKVGKGRLRRQKDFILFVRNRHCGALIRGLRNLESPCEGVRFYSFRLYEKNGEYPRGLRTSGLRGRFKSPLDTWFLLK